MSKSSNKSQNQDRQVGQKGAKNAIKQASDQSAKRAGRSKRARNNFMEGKQGRKDSKTKRVNYDNARESKVERDIERGTQTGNPNDIAWYNQNPNLLKSAGSLPFATVLGQDPLLNTQYPGIMVIYFNPCLGGETTPYAINQAALSNYSFLVHANSRNYSQDPADYTLFQLAGIEVFAAISDLIRAYGIAMDYNEENAYKPKHLLESLQFDAEDFIKNRGQLWFTINEIITRTHQIWIPNNMPYLNRQYWLNSGVYTDAPGYRSQMYVFARHQYFELSETGVSTGTALVPAQFTTLDEPQDNSWRQFERGMHDPEISGNTVDQKYTVQAFVSMINRMISKLVESQDRGQIMGNILNAYTASNIFALDQITVDYVVRPTYNAEVLTQIENLQVYGGNWPNAFFQGADGQIRVNWRYSASADGVSNSGPVNSTVTKALPGSPDFEYVDGKFPDSFSDIYNLATPPVRLCNFHIPDQPTPEHVMVATRLTVGGSKCRKMLQLDAPSNGVQETITKVVISPATTGTEVVCAVKFFSLYYSSAGSKPTLNSTRLTNIGGSEPMDDYTMGFLMSFDWHPFIYEISQKYTARGTVHTYIDDYTFDYTASFGDTDNYAYINDVEMKKLNDVALYSEFGVYTFGV